MDFQLESKLDDIGSHKNTKNHFLYTKYFIKFIKSRKSISYDLAVKMKPKITMKNIL